MEGGGDFNIFNGGGEEEQREVLNYQEKQMEGILEMGEEEEDDGDWPICVITSTSGSAAVSIPSATSTKVEIPVKEEQVTVKPSPIKVRIKEDMKSMSNGKPSNNRDVGCIMNGKAIATASSSPYKTQGIFGDMKQTTGDLINVRRSSVGGIFTYCEVCCTAFIKAGQLDQHMRDVHPEKCPRRETPVSIAQELNEHKSYLEPNPNIYVKEIITMETLPPPPRPTIPQKQVPEVAKPPPLQPRTHQRQVNAVVIPPSQSNTASKQVVAAASVAQSSPSQPSTTPKQVVSVAIPPPPQPFICSLCGKKFLIKANWEDHQKVHHHGYTDKSSSPLPSSSTASGLKIAPKSSTNTTSSTVPTSQSQITSDNIKPAAAKKGASCPPYECEFCERKFPLPFLLRKHLIIHNKPYQCSTCMERFIKIEGLNLHKRLIHDVAGMSTFKCLVCGKKDFLLLSDMYTHRIENHSQVPFQGEVEKPYGCGVCQKPYQRKGDALVCAVLGHNPTSLHEAMFQHKCPACLEENQLGYHSIRALKKHWVNEHSEKPFPEDVLLAENGYSFDCPLPKVEIDKRDAYDLKEKGPPQLKEGDLPLILEFDPLTLEKEETCVIPVFDCPDCPLTFIDVDSLRIHEQVHLQDEGPPESGNDRKRGKQKKTHLTAEGSALPISLLPQAATGFIRGKHLIPKFGCVVCGQKFRKLKRLRDHEQTHLAMDPNAPVFPKIFGRKGRKPGLIKKKVNLLGGFGKKRGPGRPRKPQVWESSTTVVEDESPMENGSPSKMSYVTVRPFRCKVCPASFNLPKSLRMHELNVHNAPHRRPGRKPGMKNTTDPTYLENGETTQTSGEQVKSEGGESSGPPPLAPGRIRVGRLEISTKFNKMIKQNVPIKICVTGENGEKTYHFQCPKCPKVFRDRRGIHLHILGHSLKTAAYRETELRQTNDQDEEHEGIQQPTPLPSSISSSARRTSDRERRIPRKLSEYEVDDEEAAVAVGIAPMEVDNKPSPFPVSNPSSVGISSQLAMKKKDGRGRPRKHPIPPVNPERSRESQQGPSTTFQEISGEIVRKWPGRPPKSKHELLSSDDSDYEQQIREGDETLDEGNNDARPPFEPPTCKICGKCFDSVMDLWYHGNQEHSKFTKVKYVPNVVTKPEQENKSAPPPPAVSGTSATNGNQNQSQGNAVAVKKNAAVLALLQRKREQGAGSGQTVETGVIKNKPQVKKVESGSSGIPVKRVKPPKSSLTRKGRPPKETTESAEEKSNVVVSRIGQLKIPPKFRNKDVLKQEKPLIVTETRADGSTITLYKCRKCPKTFRDMRGFPFHSLCHLVMSEKNNPSKDDTVESVAKKEANDGGAEVKKEKKIEAGKDPAVVVPKQAVDKKEKKIETGRDPAVVVPKQAKKEKKIETGKGPAATVPKQEKKVPGLIPLHGITKKLGGPKKWIVNASPEMSSRLVNGIPKKSSGEEDKVPVEKKTEPIPSTSRTSSIPTSTKLQSSTSENSTPEQLLSASQQQQASSEPLAKPVLSPTSNEFRFKIIKQSVILPFKKRRGRPSARYLTYMKGTQKSSDDTASTSTTTTSDACKPSPSPKVEVKQSERNQSSAIVQETNLKQSPSEVDQPKGDIPLNIEAVPITASGDILKSKPSTSSTAQQGVTSLQMDEEHGLHYKKKAKLAAILAKAQAEEAATSTKTTSANGSAGGIPPQKATKTNDASDKQEIQNGKDKIQSVAVSPVKIDVADSNNSAVINGGTEDDAISTPESSSTTTLKRKRGRPRKDSSSPTKATESTSVTLEIHTKQKKVEEEKPTEAPACPPGLPSSKWPDKEDIEVSKEEMETLKKEMEKNIKEVDESVIVSSAAATSTSIPAPSSETVPTLSPMKKRGRPPRAKEDVIPSTNGEVKGDVETKLEARRPKAKPKVEPSPSPVKKEEEKKVPTPALPVERKLRQSRKRSVDEPKNEPVDGQKAKKVEAPSLKPTEAISLTSPSDEEETSSPPTKRGRGRPRKYPASTPTIPVNELVPAPSPGPVKILNSTLSPDITSFAAPGEGEAVRRGRGRPRKSMPILTRADDDTDGETATSSPN